MPVIIIPSDSENGHHSSSFKHNIILALVKAYHFVDILRQRLSFDKTNDIKKYR